MTFVGLDVDQKPFAAWKDKPLFWVRVLDLHAAGAETAQDAAAAGGAFHTTGFNDMSTALNQALDRPPGVRPSPSPWWRCASSSTFC